jgi:hypothetical protein
MDVIHLARQIITMQPKIIIAFLSCFIITNVYAQFEKGSRMAGATIGSAVFSSGTTDYSGPNQFPSSLTSTNIGLSLSPSIGWFINNRTAVGTSLLLNYSKQKYRRSSGGITDKKDNIQNTDFGLGGYIRYYISASSSIKPFAHIYLNAGSGSTKTDGVYYSSTGSFTNKSSYEGKSSGRFFANAGINGGITKMFNPHTGLDVYVGYGYSNSQFTTTTTSNADYGDPSTPDTKSQYEIKQNFSGNALNIGIGLQVFFPAGK